MLQKVAWWFGEESSWRKELMNILVTMLYTLNSFFHFNTSVASPSVDRNTWGSGEEQCLFLTLGLKDNNFLPLAHAGTHVERDLGQRERKRWVYRTSDKLQWQMAAKLGRQLLNPRVDTFHDAVTRGTYRVYRCGTDSGIKKIVY